MSSKRAATAPYRPARPPICPVHPYQTPQERFEQMFMLDSTGGTSDGSGLIPAPIMRYSSPQLPQSPGSIRGGPATRNRRRQHHPRAAVPPSPALHLPSIPQYQYIHTPIPPLLPPLPPALVCDPPTLYGSNRMPLTPQYPHGLNLTPPSATVSNHSLPGYHTTPTTTYTTPGSSHVLGSPCYTLTPPLPAHYLPMATASLGTWRAPPPVPPSHLFSFTNMPLEPPSSSSRVQQPPPLGSPNPLLPSRVQPSSLNSILPRVNQPTLSQPLTASPNSLLPTVQQPPALSSPSILSPPLYESLTAPVLPIPPPHLMIQGQYDAATSRPWGTSIPAMAHPDLISTSYQPVLPHISQAFHQTSLPSNTTIRPFLPSPRYPCSSHSLTCILHPPGIPIRCLQLRSSSPFVPLPRPCNPLMLPQLQFPSPPLKDIVNREQSNRSTASGMEQLHEESELIVISEDDAERSSPNTAATTIPCTTADTSSTDAKGLFTFNYIDTDDHYSTTSQASSGIVSTSGFVSMPFTYADSTTDSNPSSVSTKESGVVSAASTAKPSAQKPPYSMTALVGMAISSLPNKRASPKEIYSFISSTFPFYSRSQRAWKNSVRHCLQNSKCFKPVEEPSLGYWEIDLESKENFMKGSFQKPLVLKKRKHNLTTTSTRKRSNTVNTAGASLDSIWLKYANELNIKVIPNTNVEILELVPPDSPRKQFFKVFL